MKPVTFVEPPDLAGVFEALSGGSARMIAGGSDLLGELKEDAQTYERLVSLAGLDALRRIEPRDGGLQIGALVTLSQLELGPELTGPYHMLGEAARGVATPEVRNQGTLGGNLCQRPRCLHYRNALTPCLKKGGASCPAVETPYQNYLSIFGGAGCYAVHASDLAPPLIALDAQVVLEGPSGTRTLPVESFFSGPERDVTRENVLARGEVLTSVVLPPLPSGWRGSYSKARERTAGDFPIVSAAIGFDLSGGRMQRVRIVLGGVVHTPLRCRGAEALLEGQAPSEVLAQRAADAALASAQPLAHNAFKVDLAHALITRGVTRLAS
jgi:xanthine dehydrogenase YagS FAD-binding subunit